jgi:hypothetical protein
MKSVATNLMRMLAVAGVMAMTSGIAAQAQQSWRVGLTAAANWNYVDAATEKFAPVPSHDFSGANEFELYGGVSGEYLFNDLIGAVLNVAYDARGVEKKQDNATFSPEMRYVSFDPGVRVNLGMPELYVTAGGTVAVKVDSKYNYTPGSVAEEREVTDADLNNVRDVAYGAWANVGYDIRVNGAGEKLGWYVTPYVGASYLFDQTKAEANTVDDTKWNTLSVRGGVQVKLQF